MISIAKRVDLGIEGEKIIAYANHKPTKEECKSYSKIHTSQHRDSQFYLLTINNWNNKPITHTLRSDRLHSSNILQLLENSLQKGTFVNLEKITIKQYAQNGGGDIPCCLRNCQYEGDWPPCMQDNQSNK